MELDALQKQLDAIRAAGAGLVAISPQTVEKNAEIKDRHRLDFPVLSDPGNAYAGQLGLVHTLPDDLREVYTAFGIVLPDFNGDESWSLPLATRLVVKPDGAIHTIHSDADYTTRPEVEVTLAELAGI